MLIDRYKAHKIIPAMKYPAGGRGDVLLAQPVGRHCSGYREDSGSGLHLQLFDGMPAVSMVITAAVRNLFRFKKVLRSEWLRNACGSLAYVLYEAGFSRSFW
jgi:hypothetical protein